MVTHPENDDTKGNPITGLQSCAEIFEKNEEIK